MTGNRYGLLTLLMATGMFNLLNCHDALAGLGCVVILYSKHNRMADLVCPRKHMLAAIAEDIQSPSASAGSYFSQLLGEALLAAQGCLQMRLLLR